MSSRGRSPPPHTPVAKNNPLTELLSRGRSRPRATAISASRALSVGKIPKATLFKRKSASRVHRSLVTAESGLAQLSPYASSDPDPVDNSAGNDFYSHSQFITPGGILSDMPTSASPSVPAMASSSPVVSSEVLEVNIIYRNAVEDDLEGHDWDFKSEAAYRKRATKIERQWTKWSQDIIPALLQPYMILMEETQSLRETSSLQSSQLCKGCENGRLIHVSCVFFNSKFLGAFWQ